MDFKNKKLISSAICSDEVSFLHMVVINNMSVMNK